MDGLLVYFVSQDQEDADSQSTKAFPGPGQGGDCCLVSSRRRSWAVHLTSILSSSPPSPAAHLSLLCTKPVALGPRLVDNVFSFLSQGGKTMFSLDQSKPSKTQITGSWQLRRPLPRVELVPWPYLPASGSPGCKPFSEISPSQVEPRGVESRPSSQGPDQAGRAQQAQLRLSFCVYRTQCLGLSAAVWHCWPPTLETKPQGRQRKRRGGQAPRRFS